MSREQRDTASQSDSTGIPVQLSEAAVAQFILPQLSVPKRGPRCRLGDPKPCNSILKVLDTGMQGKEVPIDKGPEGKAELHYTGICQLFAR